MPIIVRNRDGSVTRGVPGDRRSESYAQNIRERTGREVAYTDSSTGEVQRRSSPQNGIVLESKGAERDAALAQANPGIYRFSGGAVYASSRGSGSQFSTFQRREVFVGNRREQLDAQRTGVGFDVNDAGTRDYLRDQASSGVPDSTAGQLFVQAQVDSQGISPYRSSPRVETFASRRLRQRGLTSRAEPAYDYEGSVAGEAINKVRVTGERIGFAANLLRSAESRNPVSRVSPAGDILAGVGGAVRYAGENPKSAVGTTALSYGLSVPAGMATGTFLNFVGRSATARFGEAAGVRAFTATRRAVEFTGLGVAGLQVASSTPEQLGAATPSLIAGGVGFQRGFMSQRPGLYVERVNPASKSNIEYRYSGNRVEGIGTQEGTALVNVFGRQKQVPYVSNVQVSGKGAYAQDNRYFIADVELATALSVGDKSLYSGRSFGGVLDTKNRAAVLRSGDDLFSMRQGKEQVFYDDTVERITSSNSQFVQLADTPQGVRKVKGGAGFTLNEAYTYRDTTVSMFRSPYLQADRVTSRPIGYVDSRSVNVRVGRGDSRVAAQGLQLAEKFNLYNPPNPYAQRLPLSRSRRGSAQLFEPETIVRPLQRSRGGSNTGFDFIGLPAASFGRPTSPLFAYGLGMNTRGSTRNVPNTQSALSPRQNPFQTQRTANSSDIFRGTTPVSSIIPRQERIPRRNIVTQSAFRSTTRNPVMPVTVPSTPTFPGGLPPVFGFGIPPSTSKRGRGAKKRGFSYTPSLTAALFNIRGKAPQNQTGFDLRPLLR